VRRLLQQSDGSQRLFPIQDWDDDGSPCDEDCDDHDPDVLHGAGEICDDGVDQDCDGEDDACDEPTDSDPAPQDSDPVPVDTGAGELHAGSGCGTGTVPPGWLVLPGLSLAGRRRR